jgi:hypothetical protein
MDLLVVALTDIVATEAIEQRHRIPWATAGTVVVTHVESNTPSVCLAIPAAFREQPRRRTPLAIEQSGPWVCVGDSFLGRRRKWPNNCPS